MVKTIKQKIDIIYKKIAIELSATDGCAECWYSGNHFTRVMIGDVLDYGENNRVSFKGDGRIHIESENDMYRRITELEQLYRKKRLPIEKQNEECINYIYNHIK